VTRWGLILLVGYLVFGLRIVDGRKAVRGVVAFTAVILGWTFLRNHAL
jgi:hypothetical protein